MCKWEAKCLCQKFCREKKTGNRLHIIEMHGFCNFLIFCISVSAVLKVAVFFFIWSFLLKIWGLTISYF
jgi:hypothetical protein